MLRRTDLPRGAVEALAALVLGSVTGLGWQPYGLWPAIFLGLAGLAWLVDCSVDGKPGPLRRGARLGWFFGLGLGLVGLSWVHVIGWYVVPPLIAFMACWQALVGLVLAIAGGLTRNPFLRALAGAAGWSLSEFGAGRVPFGGFGWLRLAYSQVDSPLAGWLPLLGVGGLGFVIALISQLLVPLISALRRPRLALLPALVWVVALAGAPLAARLVDARPDRRTVAVGMVQGNVDGSAGPNAMGYARSVTDNHVSQTVTLMARARAGLDPTPDFVLWPENATDIDPTRDSRTAELIQRASSLAERPILVGAVIAGPGPDERQTTALWWRQDGTVEARYDKRNLVPFGEWIPLRRQLLPLLPILQEVGAQSVPGSGPGVLPVTLADGRRLELGDIICFELAWDSTVYDTVRHGAELLVVQANTATYSGTGEARQQFAMTRARAIELRRDIVVSTTNSLSAHVHPDGRVTGLTREGTAAAQTFVTPLASNVTPAVRVGPMLELLASLAGLGLIFSQLARAGLGRTWGAR